jgi:hypothetical protein
MTITINAGDFCIKRKDYVLTEDFIHVVEQSSVRRFVIACLVVDNSGNVQIVVDDKHYQNDSFDVKSSDYEYLCWLYRFHIPENVSTLDDAEITVRRFISDEE